MSTIVVDNLITVLKKELDVSQDKELAYKFNVTPNTLSAWKRSKGKLIEQVVKLSVHHGLDVNKIFSLSEKNKGKKLDDSNSFPILMADDLFSYYLNPDDILDELPRYSFPSNESYKIGFQLISQNMEPTIKVSSLVFGYETDLSKIKSGEVYAIMVKKGGIFISRFLEIENERYVFQNDNSNFKEFIIESNQIVSVFQINGMLSRLR